LLLGEIRDENNFMALTRRNFLRDGVGATAAAVLSQSEKRTMAQTIGETAMRGGTGVTEDTVPRAARIAINDLLEYGAHMRPGQRVLLIAYLDGLYGGDNIVDRQAIHWIEHAVQERGNRVEVLWVDEPARMNQWKFPDEVRAAMDRSDLVINHSFDLTVEEILAFRQFVEHDRNIPMVRNFATTAPLLCTAWAQTPQELVSEIRFQASSHIKAGLKWELSDPNGTHLTGEVRPARNPTLGYATRRESGNYLPWPEWVCPPISLGETSGTFVFDRTLSWWSRYIGIAPYFERPVTLTIAENRIVKIQGGTEAESIQRFLESLRDRLGESAFNFDTLHFGVHPQAHVAPQQCPSVLYRRLIEHSDTRNLHVHVGSPKANEGYPYWPHITGDIRKATFRVGDAQLYDNGRLTTLDDPAVLEIAARYPNRPGLGPEPFQG
jgi:hypothetical protein